MINIDTFKVVMSESSSKGNQRKFYKDGYWIKLDHERCYEGLAEEFTSKIESLIIDYPYVDYKSEVFSLDGESFIGCYSYNMYKNVNISFISLRRLFRSNNIQLDIFIKDEDTAVNIKNVVNAVLKLTGVDISGYIFRALLLDALIINEDRHFMNLGVRTDGRVFSEPEVFDNGSSLFCTNWTYRKTKTFEENIQRAKNVARPFSKFFDKQVDACIRLGTKPLLINKNGLDYLLKNYYNSFYSDEQNLLIKNVLMNRLQYYYGKGVYKFV